jgi:Divergent InlB B-repeat domain
VLGLSIAVCASSPAAAASPDCSKIDDRGYAIQQNLHASEILVDCGVVTGGDPNVAYGAGETTGADRLAGATDINLITGAETLPHVTQSESMTAANGSDVAVAYNDSRIANTGQFSGISVSHDAGATYARLNPSPFATGHSSNFGDPILVYNRKLNTWFAGDLVTGCGAQGIGLWTSSNLDTWAPGACAVTSPDADRESMWVDNTPTSPFYGRMYISWNDFSAGGALKVTHSDDGTTWTPSVTLNPTFMRQVAITGGTDGTVFEAAQFENGGGVGNPGQQNLMFKSTDGGVTFTPPGTAAIPGTFTIAGDTSCSNAYFPKIQPIWRQTGYGIPAVGPGGVVIYDYAAHGAGADEADVFYVRSTDNGTTWSAPVRLNTDSSGKEQWMPSLSITPSGVVVASWYDRRNTTDGVNYQRFYRVSVDNGATWGGDQAGTPLIPQPNQPDPNVQACYAGDYNNPTSNNSFVYDSWTDGRVSIGGNGPQQDVFAATILTASLKPTLTVSVGGNGSGTISSPGISCPGDCTESYADATTVALTATARAGSRFTGFGGACAGGTCSVALNGNKSVSGTFAKIPPPGTKITKAKVRRDGKVSFSFTGSGDATGFECALKKPKKRSKVAAKPARFKSCSSPKSYKLRPGKSKFQVRAVGPGGTDPTPAKKKVKFSG